MEEMESTLCRGCCNWEADEKGKFVMVGDSGVGCGVTKGVARGESDGEGASKDARAAMVCGGSSWGGLSFP